MIRNLIAWLVLAALALSGYSLWQQLDGPVRAVRVEGRLTAAEQQAIRDVVARNVSQGVLSLDMEALGRHIRELSWPRSVEVRRVWPDALVIRVEKESVVAAWGTGGYLTSAGKVVALPEDDRAGAGDVPTLSTSMAEPRRAMEIYQMLASRLAPAGFSIVRLAENELGEWLLTLDGGITVALGNQSIARRLDRFLLTYRQALAERADEIEHVDARYGNGIAVRWADDTVGALSRARPPGSIQSRSGERSHSSSDQEMEKPGTEYAFR